MQLHFFPLLPVLFVVHLRIPAHALDLLFVKPAGSLNPDALLLAGRLILGCDVKYAVGINVESDLNLRDTPGSRGNAVQVETPDGFVVDGHLPFTLKNMDLHRRLAIGGG
ncbi:hypothetical protein ES703_48786 [subsurface metagenome]